MADILFVSPDCSETEIMVSSLSGHGHVVSLVGDGPEALSAVALATFDAVVADVAAIRTEDLPRLRGSGLETVIVLTADPSLQATTSSMEHGVFELLQRPISAIQLSSTVRRALEHRDSRVASWIADEGRKLLDATEPGLLPQRIADLTTRIMGADDVSVMLRQPDGSLYVSFSARLPQVVQEQAVVRVGEGISGRAAESGQPVLLMGSVAAEPPSRGIKSSIVYPILHRETLLGVLNINRIDDVRPFRDDDLQRVKLLAVNVAVALENSDVVRRLVTSERVDAFAQLAAGVAHEVNNPVTYLMESCKQIQERVHTLAELDTVMSSSRSLDEVRQWWKRVEGSALFGETVAAAEDALAGAERVRGVVRDLRSLTAARGGDTAVDLNEAVRLAVRVVGVEVHGCAEVELALGDGVEVMADLGRLSVALVQLLRHRARGMSKVAGGRPRRIRLETLRQRDWVTLQVSDTGTGLPRQAVARLFEPFFTLDGHDEPLDLHVAWEIVRQLGGELRLESTSGRGTTLGILLPAAEALRIAPEPGVRRAEESRAAESTTGRPRILFVDDEPLLLRSYVRGFRGEFDVVLAEGGPQALARLTDDRNFDLIVTDVVMSGLDGIALYHRVRELAPELAKRFVFVSGSISPGDATRRLQRIANPFLEKPFELATLQALLNPPE